jgi:alpha-galactosidase
MLAYEHGADHPDGFFAFRVEPGDDRPLALHARKGNYYDGQPLGPQSAWESVWFELGLAPVPVNSFLPAYRRFFLDEIAENVESRQPYLFYNTWNYQERNHYFHKRPYLESMHLDRIDAEIEVAHRLGLDVFVIDTGWYIKTGDWLVNPARFPDGLQTIKRTLDGYGMQLGLWFNPTVAALTSEIYRAHPEYQMTRDGVPREVGKVWETEESVAMCLASDYTDHYIETMVRLHDELGVRYFKWDAISQYGCDSPDHQHGTRANSLTERADCYAYQMGRQMIRIVEEVSRRCPGVIVDFDVTEGGRFVGLGFLSVGKYFLINNGPYFSDFDIPRETTIEPDTINVFFYPGPARPRICRQGIKYDDVIPSILFLTHYLPDAPYQAQRNSLAALMLGGNGIWGDLLDLSEEDVTRLHGHLAAYKRVAAGVTRAYPRRRGFAGSSPEVYEKIDPDTATGAVIFFTVTPGTVTHVTQPLDLARLEGVNGAEAWEQTPNGRLKITVTLERDDAQIVYVNGRA